MSQPMPLDVIQGYLRAEFPQVFAVQDIAVERALGGNATLRLNPGEAHMRPGGVISGPTLMMMADAAAYAALLSLSEAAKMAVTSNLNVSFLRGAPPGRAIIQTAAVIKLGRRLSVITGEAMGEDGVAYAHTTMTYAMPIAQTG